MHYKITEELRAFLINYFTKTPNLPISYEHVQKMLNEITTIKEESAIITPNKSIK